MIPENKIITFTQDTKERKKYFKAASFAHPAKMHLSLQIYLIEHYTKPGDTILDPMAGSGTILFACTLGRNVVCVELEDKFIKMQQDNYKKIRSLGPMLGFQMGEARILQGDARNLNGLLADEIVFSPPYAEAQTGDKRKSINQTIKATMNGKQRGGSLEKYYQETSASNIGNLPYGSIEAAIFSPPFGETLGTKDKEFWDNHCDKIKNWSGGTRKIAEYGKTEGQIGNLPYKADAVITSPPYEGIATGCTEEDAKKRKIRLEKAGYDTKKLLTPGRYKHGNLGIVGNYNRDNKDNIGNLKSENYLQAMFQVYCECRKVLKDGGLLVLVVKNFIRDKKIIRLDLDTIKLCERAGFKLIDRLYRKLTQQSFWRIIYHQKFPDVPKIEYEDVLIFRAESQKK